MRSHFKRLRLLLVVAVSVPIFAGCLSEQRPNRGMEAVVAPLYHYPMVASGGYDLLFCSGAFMRKNNRWPRDFRELSDFVDNSGGYLTLGKFERVEFAPLPDNGVEITFVPQGEVHEMKFRLKPGPRSQ